MLYAKMNLSRHILETIMTTTSLRQFIMLLMLSLFAITSYASNPSQFTKAKQLINKTFHHKATIVSTFSAPKNLIGFVVKGQDHQSSVIYVDKDGDYLFLGTLINHQGKNITSKHQPKSKQHSPAIKAFQEAHKTSWFEQGNPKAPHLIYVIAEPNCSACHYLYQTIKPYIAKGNLKVRWIMVSFLKPSSLGKAAAIIASKNPAQAFAKNEVNFNGSTETGGIKAMKPVPIEIKQALRNNSEFMHSNKFHTTPIILFEDKHHQAHVLQGAVPKNRMGQFLEAIGQ